MQHPGFWQVPVIAPAVIVRGKAVGALRPPPPIAKAVGVPNFVDRRKGDSSGRNGHTTHFDRVRSHSSDLHVRKCRKADRTPVRLPLPA